MGGASRTLEGAHGHGRSAWEDTAPQGGGEVEGSGCSCGVATAEMGEVGPGAETKEAANDGCEGPHDVVFDEIRAVR